MDCLINQFSVVIFLVEYICIYMATDCKTAPFSYNILILLFDSGVSVYYDGIET